VVSVSTKRLRVVAALVVALYALVAETSVIRHHDLACSPKAASKCEACARGPEVSRIEAGFRLDLPVLVDLGDVQHRFEASPRSGRALPHTGRAPPA
jgi:hypothetical protein